jgi:energy-coupling factor transport system permease protein
MLKNITLGQYIPGKSILHRADPRTKMIWTLLIMVSVFIANNVLHLRMCLHYFSQALAAVKFKFENLHRKFYSVIMLPIGS